jgi:hypothetical protein
MEARDIIKGPPVGLSLKGAAFFLGMDWRFFWEALEKREPDMDSVLR